MYNCSTKGILVLDKIYCFDRKRINLAETLSKELELELEFVGCHFYRDLLSWESSQLITSTGRVSIKFLSGILQVIIDGCLYEESIEHFYNYGRDVSLKAIITLVLIYLPYKWLTANDLQTVKEFVRYNLPSKFGSKSYVANAGTYRFKHGEIDIKRNGDMKVKTIYGEVELPKEFSSLATGWVAINYIVEGIYRLDTIYRNNNIKGM